MKNDNFDLSTTFTMNFGENNQNIFYAIGILEISGADRASISGE